MNGLVVMSWNSERISASRPAFVPAALGADLLLEAGDRLLEGLDVREDQLGRDGLDVRRRVDASVHVHDVRVRERARDLADRVRLADVREELIAEALALGGALDDAGDVHERDRGRKDLLRAEDPREHLQPRIGQGHDADVRLDRRERVVRREHARPREGVEQGRLADVGQACDSDGESHETTLGSARPLANRRHE
jgi:hypothetical protein